MIQRKTAQEFINKLDTHIASNVNIMDEEGIIIASRDADRIGSFHEAAYRLLRYGRDEERIPAEADLPLGALPGINLPLQVEGKPLGVLGVTGNPDEMHELAYALKSSMEMLIELEQYKDRLFHRHNRKNLFMSRLLQDEPYRSREVEIMAAQLGYDKPCVRAPVLLRLKADDAYRLERHIKENGLLEREDLNFTPPDGALLIFRRVSIEKRGALEAYRRELEEFAGELLEFVQAHCDAAGAAVYIGSPQDRWDDYRSAYRQTLWLESRIGVEAMGIFFFLDHLQHYFLSRIPREEFLAGCRLFSELLDGTQRGSLLETAAALNEANLNIKEAASRLGLHRNTVSARLEKIRETFGIDPVNDAHGKELLFLLVAFHELFGEN